ncbi:hypothetical protein BDV27DRAFT_126848 [Aspergillus caelatus]|uniref:Uncharacterized protein n=1 Tax=Aspergillus caelatus TaxID=61420 RepID=A0A5N7A8P3_9EURO|nr:uncharacterized protein BDV27DRAFT_126848 [Aspergillus caelatus]KAE8365499.1 hypothetical protein BDV27DRAFT_126848 [Aspergillus caelatus]
MQGHFWVYIGCVTLCIRLIISSLSLGSSQKLRASHDQRRCQCFRSPVLSRHFLISLDRFRFTGCKPVDGAESCKASG